MKRAVLQLDLFGEPEVVYETDKARELSPEAKSLIQSCKGLDDWEIEKKLRLSREYLRNEIRNYFGLCEYPTIIKAIQNYER